jgi:hypothetical protein
MRIYPVPASIVTSMTALIQLVETCSIEFIWSVMNPLPHSKNELLKIVKAISPFKSLYGQKQPIIAYGHV